MQINWTFLKSWGYHQVLERKGWWRGGWRKRWEERTPESGSWDHNVAVLRAGPRSPDGAQPPGAEQIIHFPLCSIWLRARTGPAFCHGDDWQAIFQHFIFQISLLYDLFYLEFGRGFRKGCSPEAIWYSDSVDGSQ